MQTPLTGAGTLSFVGTRSGSRARDGAYLIIDQLSAKLEAGIRRAGVLTVYRSPGASLAQTALVTRFLDGAVASDLGPIAMEAPTCRSTKGGPEGRTLHLSGARLPKASCCGASQERGFGWDWSLPPFALPAQRPYLVGNCVKKTCCNH